VDVLLFPLAEYWWFYGGFLLFVGAMLALDLGVFHRESHAVSFKEAATWSAVWVSLALIFNALLYAFSLWRLPQSERLMAIPGFDPAVAAWQVSLEFLTGYVIEKSLSVDNIFVFVVIFGYFAIPARYQHRVLFYGILGALAFRALFITAGAMLLQYHWVLVIFGIFLILTGVKMYFASEKGIDPESNLLIKLFRRFVPVTPAQHGERFFVRERGILHATPLFVALLFLELSDVIFAVDSVPAIFAITDEPMIVFTSNIFAILGLRSMYFMLAGAVDKFHLLKYGLATVLVFVGSKMVWLDDAFGGKFPITWSLGIITAVIGGSIVLSFVFRRSDLVHEAGD
jgi:tellurite resistance protein TerC